MTRLSLAMIVRNEAEILPLFFQRHAGLFTEIVVVDTGSSDGTVDLCREQGCLLVETPWADDFAAARNAGLEAVTGGWTLFLDADEMITPADAESMHQLCGENRACVYLQDTINYLPNRTHLEWQPVMGTNPLAEKGQTGFFVARRVGLFPNRPDLRFQGRIHESVLPSAQALGLQVVSSGIPIHHYGYVLSSRINRERQERYARLARLKLAEKPQDPGALLEYATCLLEEGEAGKAQPLLERLIDGPVGLSPVVRGHFLLGRLLRERGNLKTAEELLQAGLNQDPGFRFSRLELIRVMADQEKWSGVSSLLQEAKTLFGAENPLFMREELRLLIKTGQIPAAGILARRLAGICPDWAEIKALAHKLETLRRG